MDIERDWRLTNQECYLKNRTLEYRRYPSGAAHDHCEFCFQTFGEMAEGLREGYCTQDEYHWICCACYTDFKAQFCWTLSK